MRKYIYFFILFFLAIQKVNASTKKTVIIPISGMINYGLSVFIERAVDDAKKLEPDLLIFEIDTFGGEVDAALKIVDKINTISWAKTISFVKTKAISAGALIALAGNELIMREGTTIGDCAPISYNKDGVTMLGEKFQSPLRAKFRALAEKNGYPVLLAEAMVSKNIEVLEIKTSKKKFYLSSRKFEEYSENQKKEIISKKVVIEKGNLLTMHSAEAVKLGFAKFEVKDFDNLLEKINLKKENIIKRFQLIWSEKFVIFLDRIAPFLLFIGLAGLYIEIRTPGLGLPGIVGLICLTLVFGSKFFIGLANYTELMLFFIGFILLLFEIFVIPGFGIAGIMGILFIFISLLLSFQNFVIPEFPWEFDFFYKNVLTLSTVIIFSIILFLTSLFFAGPSLSKSIIAHKGSENRELGFRPSSDFIPLIHKTGITLTDLRPSGYAEIEGERLNVVSEGVFIAKNSQIKVIEVIGNRIVVNLKGI